MADSVKLQKIVIEGAADGPHMLITGGVHGDEYESMAAIRRLAAELRALVRRVQCHDRRQRNAYVPSRLGTSQLLQLLEFFVQYLLLQQKNLNLQLFLTQFLKQL